MPLPGVATKAIEQIENRIALGIPAEEGVIKLRHLFDASLAHGMMTPAEHERWVGIVDDVGRYVFREQQLLKQARDKPQQLNLFLPEVEE